jgi:TonB family protein
MRTVAWGVALAVALQAAFASSGRAESLCKVPRPDLDRFAERIELDTRYPSGQEFDLGEGWVRLGFTVTPQGAATDIRVMDALGSPSFVRASTEAVAKSRWRPAVRRGQPIAFHRAFEFEYRMRGENRAGVHNLATRNYDIAYANRQRGDYRRSVDLLLDTLKLDLNMYEYSTVSYGLIVSYLGLNDRRRALRHARHASIGGGGFADKGQRRGALAYAAELAGVDNSFRESVCLYELLKEKYPDFTPSPALQQVLATAERELRATTPLRTDVEILEPLREEVAPAWGRQVFRRTLSFSGAQGGLKSIRVVCPTHVVERNFPITEPIDVDQSVGACTLYIFGDPGSKVVVDER